MKRQPKQRRPSTGPSQRQLRAGELVRHALMEILRAEHLRDDALAGVSVTVTEVRLSPDLKHAICFVEPLGGEHAEEVVAALNRSSRYLRGQLGPAIVMRFTPDLKFVRDESFEGVRRMDEILSDPRIRRDVEAISDDEA